MSSPIYDTIKNVVTDTTDADSAVMDAAFTWNDLMGYDEILPCRWVYRDGGFDVFTGDVIQHRPSGVYIRPGGELIMRVVAS